MIAPATERPSLAKLLIDPGVPELLAALDGAGEETRIVGGAVRNALMGVPVSEVDFATTALPAEVTRRAKAAGLKAVPTGIAHGTVTVIVAGRPFEVTTLREDIDTDGRHAVVRFGRSFAADAARRDFTINALSIGRDGVLHDEAGGLADIAARRVRFIGDARRRVREDYLRILRFFRFSAAYGVGSPDPDGYAACIALGAGLRRLSAERVRTELLKLMAAPGVGATASAMLAGGLWAPLIGGVPRVGRLAALVGASPGESAADPLPRLAALAVATREDAERLRLRLRLSNAQAKVLEGIATALERLHGRRLAGAPGADPAFVETALDLGAGAMAAALAIDPGPDGRAAARSLAREAERLPAFPLAGADILRRGVPAGPRIGRILALARQRWIAAGCPLDRASLDGIAAGAIAAASSGAT